MILIFKDTRGPTYYNDLLTVNDTRYSTVRETAQKHRLLETSNAILCCLKGIVLYQISSALRIKPILTFYEPENIKKLWDRVSSCNGEVFFVNGPDCTGKTFPYHALLAHTRTAKQL